MTPARPPRPGARRGSALAEFSLVAPLFMMLTLGLIEGAWQTLTAAVLDLGVRQASRFGAVGSAAPDWLPAPAPTSREDALRRIVLHYGTGVLDPSRLSVTLTAYAGPTALRTGVGGVAGTAGEGSAMVMYRFDYIQPAFTLSPLMEQLWGRNVFRHQSRTVVRNEPF